MTQPPAAAEASGRLAARWVLPIDGPPVRDAAVVWLGDRIVGLEPMREDEAYACDIITPGMVNAHAHLEYGAPFADLATSDLPFPDWILQLSTRARTLTDEDWLASARDGVRRMLRTGTTSVADVVTFGPGAVAAGEAGMGGVSYVEIVGEDERTWGSAGRGREQLHEMLAAIPPGRTAGVSPHTLYTLGTSVFREAVDLARDRGLRLHTHLAETAEESEYVLAGTGRWEELGRRFGLEFELLGRGAGVSPVRHLADIGGLGPDVHVAHGVHVDAADRSMLRARGSAVALCVRSNATLRAGTPPVTAYLAEGSPIAVGTDSLASAPDLDLLAELRALRRVALAQGAAPAGLASRLVDAATRGGAAAMGLSDVGVLRPGAWADLALFDLGADGDGDGDTDGDTDGGGDPCEALLSRGICIGTVLGGRSVHGPAALDPPGLTPREIICG